MGRFFAVAMLATMLWGCGDKVAVTIGRGPFDQATHKIAEVTDTFVQGDTLSLVAEKSRPFGVNEYSMQVYMETGGSYKLIGHDTKPLGPSARGLYWAFPVTELKGPGKYRIELVLSGDVAAKKDFTVR